MNEPNPIPVAILFSAILLGSLFIGPNGIGADKIKMTDQVEAEHTTLKVEPIFTLRDREITNRIGNGEFVDIRYYWTLTVVDPDSGKKKTLVGITREGEVWVDGKMVHKDETVPKVLAEQRRRGELEVKAMELAKKLKEEEDFLTSSAPMFLVLGVGIGMLFTYYIITYLMKRGLK